MMDRILDAFHHAGTQKEALTAVARILQSRNPRLTLVAAIIHADAIAYCLYTEQGDSESCATKEALNALADRGN